MSADKLERTLTHSGGQAISLDQQLGDEGDRERMRCSSRGGGGVHSVRRHRNRDLADQVRDCCTR